MLTSEQEKMLTILYLFMHADGMCNENEIKNFDLMCRSLRANKAEKNDIISFCSRFDFNQNDNSEMIIKIIDDILMGRSAKYKVYNSYFGLFCKDNIKNDNMKNLILWNMINLGYADSEYTKAEKKVIDFLIDKWKIDKGIVAYMIDTADTILALVNKKEWLKTLNKPEAEINKLTAIADKEIEKIQSNLELTISEEI